MMSNEDTKERNITSIIKDQKNGPEGLIFPCKYPIKAMGENTNRFLQEMLFIAQKHCPDTQAHHVSSNKSKAGKYQSVTITVEVESRAHLEGLYIEIKSHKDVKWTL